MINMKWEYKKYNREYHKNRGFKDRNIIKGFDTETCKGNIFVIADDVRVLHNNSKPLSLDQILNFLTYRKNKLSYNFFYNMRFDMQSILKLLPKQKIKRFYEFGECQYKNYKISGVDNKFITIAKHKNAYKYWDISSFLRGGLNKNALKYLGENKIDNIDVQKFDDKEYIKDKMDDIVKYCKKDCVLTRELARYFITLCERANFKFVDPYSPAYLSQINLIDRCDIPTLKHVPHDAIKYALNSYHGGLFDIYQRGTFDKVNSYDINSAYPYEIRFLKDIQKGYFKYVHEISKGSHIDGWYKCKIKLNKPLLPYKKRKIYYPVGCFENKYITKREIEFIRSHDLGMVEVVDGWEFIPFEIVLPFERFIDKLYEWRNELKIKDDDLQLVIKIIMNSIYGKFIQSITKKEIVEGISDFFMEIGDEKINYDKIKQYGKLFNPFWASQITANTRLSCLKLAHESLEDVIAIQTDSVTFANGYKPKHIKTSDKLGDWDREITNDKITILNTGIYQYHESGKYTLRGGISNFFNSRNDTDLLHKLKENKDRDKITMKKLRPITLKKSLNSLEYSKIDTNKFIVDKKEIKINSCDKRNFDRDFKDCADILENNVTSKPLKVGDL